MQSVNADFASVPASDPVAGRLRLAILIVLAFVLAVAGYALIGGVLQPAAPRTQAEALLTRARAAVKADRSDGAAWAQLARAQYLTGRDKQAYESIASAKEYVKDDSIRLVNVQELDMLVRDGRNAEALKRSERYMKKDAEIRVKIRAEALAKGLDVPLDEQNADNQPSIQLFLLRATAQMNLGKPKEAVKSYDNVLLMSPLAADVLALRGAAKVQAGDAKGAIKDFESALKYMPDDKFATQGLAQARAAVESGAKK